MEKENQKSVTYCYDAAYNFDGIDQDFRDCTLFIPDQEPLQASRAILSNQSSFFYNVFTSDTEEAIKKEVEIKYNPCNAFPLLLEYIQTEFIEITPENIMPLIEISKYYLVDSLYDGLCEKLNEVLTKDNILDFVQVCYDNKLNAALEIISTHVSRLYDNINRDEFTNIFDIKTFCKILGDAVDIYDFDRTKMKIEIIKFMGDEQPQTQEEADALNNLVKFSNDVPNNWKA